MSKKSSKRAGAQTQVWDQVPAHHLALFHKRRAEQIERQKAEKVIYPPKEKLPVLTELHIQKLGFTDHDLHDILGSGLPAAKAKGKGSGGKGGGGRKLPNPNVVATEVKAEIAKSGLTPVGMDGDVVWGEHNLEFCDKSKVQYFDDAYKAIIPLAHIWLLAEVSADGVAELAKITGYVGFCGDENSRGQASGILIHPDRFEVMGEMEQIDITNIQGTQDLRKAPIVHLKDKGTRTDSATGEKITGEQFWACSVHLKSMRGGEQVTASIRKQQADILARELSGAGCVGGDWNCKFPNAFSQDLVSLKNAGFILDDPTNNLWTQAMGSWLDAFLTLDVPKALGKMTIIKWWQKLSSGRAFTDHAMVTSK